MSNLGNILLVVGLIAYVTSGHQMGGWMYDIYHKTKDKSSSWILNLLWPATVINNRRNKYRTRFERYHDCWEDLLPHKVSKEYYTIIMSGVWGFKLLWNIIILLIVGFLLLIMGLGSFLALGIALPLKKWIGNSTL